MDQLECSRVIYHLVSFTYVAHCAWVELHHKEINNAIAMNDLREVASHNHELLKSLPSLSPRLFGS